MKEPTVIPINPKLIDEVFKCLADNANLAEQKKLAFNLSMQKIKPRVEVIAYGRVAPLTDIACKYVTDATCKIIYTRRQFELALKQVLLDGRINSPGVQTDFITGITP